MLRGVGRCSCLFWVAISLDLAGLALLLLGIFANVQVMGKGIGDCLIYSGAIIVFLSLIWWLTWCTGNIEVSSLEALEKGKESGLAQLTSRFSARLAARCPRGLGGLSTAGGGGQGEVQQSLETWNSGGLESAPFAGQEAAAW